MTLRTGDSVPSATLTLVGNNGPAAISTEEFFNNKTVVLFGVPGAFTPTCSEKHLPGYIQRASELQAAGADAIACITVNDPFVVAAWADAQSAEGIAMLADGNADFVTALGMNIDMSEKGFGMRSARFALIAENGVITYLAKESETKDHDVSAASTLLEQLSK